MEWYLHLLQPIHRTGRLAFRCPATRSYLTTCLYLGRCWSDVLRGAAGVRPTTCVRRPHVGARPAQIHRRPSPGDRRPGQRSADVRPAGSCALGLPAASVSGRLSHATGAHASRPDTADTSKRGAPARARHAIYAGGVQRASRDATAFDAIDFARFTIRAAQLYTRFTEKGCTGKQQASAWRGNRSSSVQRCFW